jgi:hypothetical protein
MQRNIDSKLKLRIEVHDSEEALTPEELRGLAHLIARWIIAEDQRETSIPADPNSYEN